MNKPIDWSKPVQTVDGKPLRVLCTDRAPHHHPVVALDAAGAIRTYMIDGTLRGDGFRRPQAMNVPVMKHGWVNVFSTLDYANGPWAKIYPSKAEADDGMHPFSAPRVACKKIEWEE